MINLEEHAYDDDCATPFDSRYCVTEFGQFYVAAPRRDVSICKVLLAHFHRISFIVIHEPHIYWWSVAENVPGRP